MGLLGKLFGGNDRNAKLAAWGNAVPLDQLQREVMWELWLAGKSKKPPQIDPLSKLDAEAKNYILKICGADFRPREFGDANVLRLSSYRHFKDQGFSTEQSAVLTGMMFNMVGRRDL
jgi:hypothetical protein